MTTSNRHEAAGAASQTVLITGASAGIGKATAMRLLQEGYTVYAAARRVENMQDLEDLGATALKMDVTREEDLVAGVYRVIEEQGGVDILINNAGFGLYGPMEDVPLDDARYQFEVNLFGLARLTQLVLPSMRERRTGRIVNVSSIAGKMHGPLGSWYIATKHALEGWSDCLRLELKRFGIDVIIIEPGLIRTEFGSVAFAPMVERSANSPYSDIVNGMTKRLDSYKGGSQPSVIADTILKSVRARRPKTRYAAGQYAKPALLLRRLVSDRMFDRIIGKMAG
ncbi:MAG: oxidoreductase [Chloroflexi bacterium]|nr:oxidoreductase [Chloroflexota bacterium]